MLRGFRWQFIALILAALLFVITLVNRASVETVPPTETPQLTIQTPAPVEPSQTPNPGVLIQPETVSNDIPTFREGLVGSVQRLNPLLADLSPAEHDITSLIFEGLTRINAFGEPEPALAKSWVISSDLLEYVVSLRDDVLWQDGVPFDANDVVYTMSVLSAPDYPGPAEVGTFWRSVETEALGDHLVRFRLSQPLASFMDKLRVSILPAHALQGTPAAHLVSHPFNLSPIGTGPYQLEVLRGSGTIQQVVLRRAPVYRQRQEGQTGFAIDRLSFQLYPTFDDALAGLGNSEIDGLATNNRYQRVPLLDTASSGSFGIHTALDSAVGMLIFNWQRDQTPFFREQRVRVALAAGINRSSVIERWLLDSAIIANSPMWPGNWAYTSDLTWPTNDLATAQFLLQTANLNVPTPEAAANNGDSEQATPTESPYLLNFSILSPDEPALVNMLREMAVQWSQLNVNVTIDAVDPEAYQQRLEVGDFDAALVEFSLGGSADPDVYAFWHQGQYPDGLNYGGEDDTDISELLEKARRDPSGINRGILYRQFQQDFVERAIAIPLYYPLFTYVTSAKVQGVQLGFIGSPADRFRTLKDWTLSG